MGMSLVDMQDKILERLKEVFPAPQYQVEDYPDDPVNYQFAHSNAAILLVFKDRKFDRGQATDGTVQTNRPVFQIAFMCRSLRSKGDRDGAYNLLGRARGEDDDTDGLKGFDIGRETLTINREYFQTLKPGGVWIFGQDWQLLDIFN